MDAYITCSGLENGRLDLDRLNTLNIEEKYFLSNPTREYIITTTLLDIETASAEELKRRIKTDSSSAEK